MKVDLVIATYNRAEQIKETLENVIAYGDGLNHIFVVNNNSTDHTREVLDGIKHDGLSVIHNRENLGAAGGKNVGLRKSNADIIIVMDDDAIFFSDRPVAAVVDIFSRYPDLGVIQFKIINFQSRKILRYEFPGDDPQVRGDDSFEIGYFIGAGHALRKSMLEDIGYYPDNFGLYAHEEVDLSYRAVIGGYRMRYESAVAVLHKKAPGGRLSKRETIYTMFYNRLVMTRKYLPFPYSVINNFLWFVKTAVDARSAFLALSAYLDYFRNRSKVRLQKMGPEALLYMRRNNGRLFR
jgi:GT2 family glycosyltransferase